ncbi:MAG: hypothetical protein BWY60_00308 [Actinobacteria bacterium ADurb.Bin346]|nr:MAG: hypothetical protein BWY60_00308 [Actinobacteria bacterium ADurb.Bin346]
MLAIMNGRPSPAEKTASKIMPCPSVSILLARRSIAERIIPTQGTQPNEKIMPNKNDHK